MKATSFFSTLVLIFSIQMLAASPLLINPTSAPFEKIIFDDDDDKTTITIIDAQQKTLIVEKLKGVSVSDKQVLIDRYSKTLKMQDGQYTLVIKQKNSRISMPFTFDADKSKLVVTDKKGGYLPLLKVKDNHLDVNYFIGRYADVALKILDNNGDNIYSDTHINVCKVHQRYDISDLPYGTFTVQLTVGEDISSYVVTK
jgi:hypothetical protein